LIGRTGSNWSQIWLVSCVSNQLAASSSLANSGSFKAGFSFLGILVAAISSPLVFSHLAGCNHTDMPAPEAQEHNNRHSAVKGPAIRQMPAVARSANCTSLGEDFFHIIRGEAMTADVFHVGLIPVEEESGDEEIVSCLCIQMQGCSTAARMPQSAASTWKAIRGQATNFAEAEKFDPVPELRGPLGLGHCTE